ncbi:MAG: hypothetical protein ABI338_03980 [Gemmatimonadaceae bacterium]
MNDERNGEFRRTLNDNLAMMWGNGVGLAEFSKFREYFVPEILLSGDHAKIAKWEMEQEG